MQAVIGGTHSRRVPAPLAPATPNASNGGSDESSTPAGVQDFSRAVARRSPPKSLGDLRLPSGNPPGWRIQNVQTPGANLRGWRDRSKLKACSTTRPRCPHKQEPGGVTKSAWLGGSAGIFPAYALRRESAGNMPALRSLGCPAGRDVVDGPEVGCLCLKAGYDVEFDEIVSDAGAGAKLQAVPDLLAQGIERIGGA
jgi:hypothetical protein